MLYRLQEAKAKQQKEKDKKSEKEMKKKAAKETKERQAGDYREIWGPATANKSWEVTSQSSLGSSMVAERSEATEASSDVSSLNPPPPGFSYDTAYESGETEPQLSSLAVKPVVAQPTGKVSPGNSLNQSNQQQHPPHVQLKARMFPKPAPASTSTLTGAAPAPSVGSNDLTEPPASSFNMSSPELRRRLTGLQMDQLPPPIPVPVLTPVPTQLELQSSSPTVQQSNTPAKASVRRPRIELNKRCKDPPEDMFADHQREPAAEVSAMSASTPALTSVQSSPAATVEEDSNIEVQEIKQLSSKRKRRAIYSSSNEEETGEKSELVITPTRNQFNNVSDNSPVSKCPKTGAYVSPGVTIAPEMSPPSPRPGSDDSGEEMIVVQEDDVPVAPPPVAPTMCFCHQTGHRCHLCNIKVCNFCSIDYLGDEDKRVHQDCFQRHNPFPVFHPSDADIANHDNLIQRALGLNSDSWADTKIPRRNLFATSPSSPSTPISSTSSPSTATSTSSERQVSVIMKTPERQVRQVFIKK